MAVTAAEFKERFRELACLDDAVVTRWLDEAARNLSECQWAGKYNDGLAYLAAHLISIFESDALSCGEPGAGPVVSEREGSVAVSYAVADEFKKDSMGATKYGRRYLEILKTIFVCRCI